VAARYTTTQTRVTRELLILRHGKSAWATGLSDFDRPLKSRGKRNARQIGEWLITQERVPDLCVSSPAKRAAGTAKRAWRTMGLKKRDIVYEPRLYHPDKGVILDVVRHLPNKSKRALIVSHNYGLEQFVFDVAEPATPPISETHYLPTSALVLFRINGQWCDAAWGAASLVAWVYPRSLD
jgi:phosphohistidine phosphatase